eukprot:COSAG04_NODE_6457_length_1322_cov_1.960752_1_plen_74_part_10
MLCLQGRAGDATAQCVIGYCYAAGQGVRQHWAEALKWYRAAAEQVRLALLLAAVSAGALAALIAGCAAGPPERA